VRLPSATFATVVTHLKIVLALSASSAIIGHW